jgi:hypothetical protein
MMLLLANRRGLILEEQALEQVHHPDDAVMGSVFALARTRAYRSGNVSRGARDSPPSLR